MATTQEWQCKVCGYIHEGDEPPEECPVCGVGPEEFELLDGHSISPCSQ